MDWKLPVYCHCEDCPLDQTCGGPVLADGGTGQVMVVGDFPSDREDRLGKPFSDEHGKLLREVFADLGYDDVTYTYIVKCCPPGGKLKASYLKHCYEGVEIGKQTKLIFLVGNTALKAVLGEKGITTWNGVRVERHGKVYIPLVSPAYVMQNPGMLDTWLEVIDSAQGLLDGSVKVQHADTDYEYIVVRSKPDVKAMYVDLMDSPKIAFDTETAWLDPHTEDNCVLCCSFANAHRAYIVPIDHPQELAPICDESLALVCDILEDHPCVIGHNIKFDQMQMMAYGCQFEACGDTMLLSFLVDSRRGIHGLKRLAGYYLGMYDYDAELQDWIATHSDSNYAKPGGTYANIPPSVLYSYAGQDAVATFQLEAKLLPMLTEKQLALYHEFTMPASNTLAEVQYNGFHADPKQVKRYHLVYTAAMDKVLARIRADKYVVRYVEAVKSGLKGVKLERFQFNPASWQQKAVVLYGTGQCTWLHTDKYTGKWEHYEGTYYGMPAIYDPDSGNPTTRRGIIEQYADNCPLVKDLVLYGMLKKVLGTYINPLYDGKDLSDDGNIHSTFNMHVVETGRISSSQPNLQNIPAPEKEPDTILAYMPIKMLYGSRFANGGIMSIDYSGMELRVFASLARCEPMLEIHRSGADFHRMVGSMISGKRPEELTITERYYYKWTNWTLLYGGSAHTLHNLYGIPLDEAYAVIDAYYKRFPEVLRYKEECAQFARDNGFIETPFGIRRPLPYINDGNPSKRNMAERHAVNTPVQGAAGQTTIAAMVIVDSFMQQGYQAAIYDWAYRKYGLEHMKAQLAAGGYQSLIVNTVHDSIVFDVYPGEEDAVAQLCTVVMENIVEVMGKVMPSIDMSWLLSPLKADVEYGSHYGNETHYEIGGLKYAA